VEAVGRELLASDPEVIVAQEFTVLGLRSLKVTKPVVFGFSGDPLDVQLVQSWARPGSNFTGMSYLAIELVGKRIELIKEWLPQPRRIAVLARPQHPGEPLERKASEEAAAKLGLELSYFPYTSSVLPTRDLGDLETAFRAIVADRCDALVVFPDSAMYEIGEHVARFALEAKLPSVSGWSSFASKGLLVYGPNVRALYRSPRSGTWSSMPACPARTSIFPMALARRSSITPGRVPRSARSYWISAAGISITPGARPSPASAQPTPVPTAHSFSASATRSRPS